MKIKVINKSNHRLPEYATPGSAGFDFKANIDEPWVIHPMERLLVPTGLYFELPEGYELQIRPRSGLALKYGIGLGNMVATIDQDYKGEVKIILINLGSDNYVISPGDRIAQGIISPVVHAEFEEVSKLSETERGEGGFGHSGK